MLYLAHRRRAAGSARCRSSSSSGARAHRSCRRGVLLESLITPVAAASRHGRQRASRVRARAVLWFGAPSRCQSPPPKPPSLSVFFPAYNDSGTIASMVIRAVQAARDADPRLRGDRRQRRQRRRTRPQIARRAGAHAIPHVRVVHHAKNRGYGGALRSGFAAATQGLDLLHRRRRAVRPGGAGAAVASAWRPDVDLVNGYKISRSDPLHRIVIGRIYHHIVKLLFGLTVRDVDCDFRLMRRRDLRPRPPREDQRRHLPGDDEEDPGRRLPHRRGAGAPLPPRLRQVAVLQLPPHLPDRHRRDEALVRARRPARAPARRGQRGAAAAPIAPRAASRQP